MPSRGQASRWMSKDYYKIFHKLRLEGKTYKDIGDRFGIGATTVAKAIKRYLESINELG